VASLAKVAFVVERVQERNGAMAARNRDVPDGVQERGCSMLNAISNERSLLNVFRNECARC
jgi:hypothetical protein